MSWLRSRFFQAVVILVVSYVVLRWGISPPAPWSVVSLYMSIVLMAVQTVLHLIRAVRGQGGDRKI